MEHWVSREWRNYRKVFRVLEFKYILSLDLRKMMKAVTKY